MNARGDTDPTPEKNRTTVERKSERELVIELPLGEDEVARGDREALRGADLRHARQCVGHPCDVFWGEVPDHREVLRGRDLHRRAGPEVVGELDLRPLSPAPDPPSRISRRAFSF